MKINEIEQQKAFALEMALLRRGCRHDIWIITHQERKNNAWKKQATHFNWRHHDEKTDLVWTCESHEQPEIKIGSHQEHAKEKDHQQPGKIKPGRNG